MQLKEKNDFSLQFSYPSPPPKFIVYDSFLCLNTPYCNFIKALVVFAIAKKPYPLLHAKPDNYLTKTSVWLIVSEKVDV